MRAVGRWLARVLGTAAALVIVVAALPYASKLMDLWMPGVTGASIVQAATLSREIKGTARLETTTIDEEGILTSSTSALFLGEVQRVAIQYAYHASVGISLDKVQLRVEGNKITFVLPAPEVLADSLIPDYAKSTINDFWYKLTDVRRQQLLDDEQLARRTAVTEDQLSSDAAWSNTVAAFETYIASWLSKGNSNLTFAYERAVSAE